MALIDLVQRNFLLEQAAKQSLLSANLTELNNNFKKDKLEAFGVTNTYGNPTFRIFTPKLGSPIDMVAIKKQSTALLFDLKVLKEAKRAYTELVENSLTDLHVQVENLNKLSLNLLKKIQSENNRIQDKANWVLSDSFKNVFNLDLANSSVSVDTVGGLVSLPLSTKTIKPLEISQLTGQSLNVTSSPNDLLDNSNKSWKINCTDANSSSTLRLTFNREFIQNITIDPTGFDTTIALTVYGKELLNYTTVLYSKTTIPINLEQVEKIDLTLSCSSTVLPKVVGIRSISFNSTSSTLSGNLITKEFEIPSFNYIKIVSTEYTPVNTSIDWYWYQNNSWKKLAKNKWIAITDINYTTLNIPILNLQTQGKYNLPYEDSNISYEGKLQVGVDQFEVSAELTSVLGKGNLIELPLKENFKSSKRCWSTPNTLSITPLDTPCPVQAITKGTSDANFIPGGTLVSSTGTPLGVGLTWIPVSNNSRSLQKDFRYKFSVQVFCEESVTISDAAYWFIQGFKQLGSPTYKQSKFSLGSFTMYVNDILVCGETYADTIYEDNSAETSAKLDTGRGFVLNLKTGWNTIEIYLFCPTTPSFVQDSTHLEDYLQLTIYPNIFDTTEQLEYGITQVIGSGEFNPISYFDLMWKVPKDFRYWGWSEVEDATIQFNTTTNPILDYFYGGSNSNSYPNLALVYLDRDSTLTTTTKFKASLLNSGSLGGPTISEVEILTK